MPTRKLCYEKMFPDVVAPVVTGIHDGNPRLFSLYIGLSLSGAIANGLLFQLWQAV